MKGTSLLFTTLNKKHALFPLPCVTDARSLVGLVRSRAPLLESHLVSKMLKDQPGLSSRSFETQSREKARALCMPLRTLREQDVEEVVYEKHGLTDQRIVTCLVPYQLAANIILSRLPPEIREESIAELKAEEAAVKSVGYTNRRGWNNRWITWFEQDVYVGDGLAYLNRIDSRRKERVPVFAVAGHIDHGKTTLLDALQNSRVADTENHGITQTIRAFTTAHPTHQGELFTFLDVPGHRIFVETRYHAQRLADCVLLVVSVIDGVRSQTQEAVKVALNLDKPIIVVLNKLDELSDALSAKMRVGQVLRELANAGLDVTIVEREADLDKLSKDSGNCHHRAEAHQDGRKAKERGGGDATAPSTAPSVPHRDSSHVYLLPMKRIDPGYRGNARHPVLDVRRKCFGVCISAALRVNLPTLWRLMCEMRDALRPSCHSTTATSQEHNAAVQAVVVESSKHLFDEEGFRQNSRLRAIQRGLDRAERRRLKKRDHMSTSAKMNAFVTSGFRQYKKKNRTSTSSLVISAIVREGVLSPGMRFVADQAEGKAEYLLDYWGNLVTQATPGMAVTIIDTNSTSGCPSPGIHVLSVTDEKTQHTVYHYRRMLQWYVEIFTSKLHLLKPRGMDVRFTHLGDYGQLEATHTLEYQLLYGAPPAASPPDKQLSSGGVVRSQEELAEGNDATSLGAYLSGLNAAEEAEMRTKVVAVSSCSGVLESGERSISAPASPLPLQEHWPGKTQTKRVTQGIVPHIEEQALDHTWHNLQLTEKITSAEAYERHLRQCVQVGVLLKVDTYHTGRMLTREIQRMGTRKVAFQVIGVRFGPLTVEDIGFFAQTVKVIVCFRNPYAPSMDLDHYIEINDQWVLYTDHFADIETFLKWCAVALHKEYHANDGRMSDRRLYVPAEVDQSATLSIAGGGDASATRNPEDAEGDESNSTPPASAARKRKLLVYRGNSEDGVE